MANKKFNWSNFTREFHEAIIYSPKTDPSLRPEKKPADGLVLIPIMDVICPRPDKHFVMTYRKEIEEDFLKRYPEAVREAVGSDIGTNHLSTLKKLSGRKMTSSLADMYIRALYLIGGGEYASANYSFFTNVREVNLEYALPGGEISIFDFQKDASDALKKHFIGKNALSGMLVMPTGSGKTRTSAAFLLQTMIPAGYQIIWLTHRHMLINQAAKTIYDNSPVIKLFDPGAKRFKLACISGEHQSVRAMEKDDSVIIISVQSACRGLDHIDRVLGEKVMIVIDEAHHSVAKSYRKTVDHIRSLRPDAKLLGLTATPVRSDSAESAYLMKMYGGNIVYSISMSTLITTGILSEPHFERVDTGENYEVTMSLDEKKYIKRWGELSETLVERIARSSSRNRLIVEQYLNNRERYGKTLIFALNGYHAYTLCLEFKKHGVKCEYIYAHNNPEFNSKMIRDFAVGRLDVLININILTEGSDVPDIETVFLTRPTSSDVLLMQMIGRAMRGRNAGGTEKANIVDFNDKWDTFNKWLNPKWLIESECGDIIDKDSAGSRPHLIPIGMVRDIYNAMTLSGGFAGTVSSVPYGWFNLLDNGEDYRLIVFENQYEGYSRIINDRKQLFKSGDVSPKGLIQAYFRGFVVSPSEQDMKIFWSNIRDEKKPPEFFKFELRSSIDPYLVAEKIRSEGLDWMTYPESVYNTYPAAEQLFGSLERYREKIFNSANYGMKPAGYKVEEIPLKEIPFKIDKPYNLKALTKEVIDEMFGGKYDGIKSITWTDKPYRTYYGVYYPAEKSIKINIILNASCVPRETVKYVIYHELLHRDNHLHDKAFRLLEHKYPAYTEHEHFLDYKFGNYRLEM